MSLKRILFIALCALLVITLILTVVAVVKVVGLFSAPDATQPSQTNPSTSQTNPSTQVTEPSSQPTEPSSQPTVPPTSQPTEPPVTQPSTEATQHVHNYELVDSKAATCSEAGWRDLRCECGDAKWEPLDKLPHTFGYGQTIPATCEAGGYTRFTCSVCNTVEDRNLTDPLGHSYDNGTYFPESCTEGDYMVYTCTNQGCPQPQKTENGSHAALGHQFGNWNENDDGILQQTCSRCKVFHTTEDLRVRADQFTEKLDQNNKPYKLHEIWVGTQYVPLMYRFVILDAVSQGSLENRYDYETGLSVTFVGTDGKTHTVVLNPRGDQTTLTLEEEPPATQPPTEATQPSTEATQPATEATQPSTEATQPATEATQPSTETSEPATEPSDPTEPSQE